MAPHSGEGLLAVSALWRSRNGTGHMQREPSAWGGLGL
jgi:hypothetical protein